MNLRTHYTEHLSAMEFTQALADAEPGTKIIYAIGTLATALVPGKEDKDWGKLVELHGVTQANYKNNSIRLIQRRLTKGDGGVNHYNPNSCGTFEYIAVKRCPPNHQPSPTST